MTLAAVVEGPKEMEKDWPTVKLHPKTADREVVPLSALLQEVLTRSPHAGALAQPEPAE
jgi:hypothetical protein